MREKNGLQKIIRFLIDAIVTVCLAWFLTRSFLSQSAISGHSMEPTLSSGDLVLVDILTYQLSQPKRMDIVMFRRNDSTENVKRVVGLPGEIVWIQNGHIFINGEKLDSDMPEIALAGIAANPVELSADEYFLIGDNADSSEDSRFVNIGNVKRERIQGKIWFRILPLSELGRIE